MESKVKVKSADDSDSPSEVFELEIDENHVKSLPKKFLLGDLSTA